MHIEQIITLRNEPWCGADYDLVHLWEDQFAAELGAELYYDTYRIRGNRWLLRLPWIASAFQTNKQALKFRMLPLGNPPGDNKRNICPIIIDFYLRTDEELQRFYRTCNRNPIVYISSREVYDFLCEKNCPLPIRHLPLSLPNGYQLRTLPAKRYDVVMLGRQNRLFKEYLTEYAKTHPIAYVYRDAGEYKTSDGISLGALRDRQSYWQLMQSARVGLYATPGMDDARPHTNGFSQVTPRFLEYIAAGCHVLSRYEKNADTDYFELDTMSTQIQSYEDFSKALDRALAAPVPMEAYKAYMDKHYTSTRIKMIADEKAY